MADIIPWVATGATVLAAIITASNLGTRITGYGFCVFLAGSLAWIATALVQGDRALLATNVILTATNIFGIWRWLGRESEVEKGAETAADRSRAGEGETLFATDLLSKAPVRTGSCALGHCVNAMAGSASGKIDYVVVSAGGVGGVGETLRRLDWKAISIKDGELTTRMSSAEFEQLPVLERDRWPGR